MNNSNTPKPDIIVPFFLLSGLLAIITISIGGCSSSGPRPLVAAEPEEPLTITAPAVEKTIRVKASHPRQYTVKKGDTLWGISSLFLMDPWYWPEIWHKNMQIQNPHLIFPGDVLTLVYVNGQPQILVNETQYIKSEAQPQEARKEVQDEVQHKEIQQVISRGLPVKKLSPNIRSLALEASIPSIPGDAIRQFLSKPRIVTEEQLEEAPRIIASQDKHLILGSGNRVYIRGEIDKERVRYSVFRPGDELLDPETGELLGYEAKYAGELRIVTYDDPASADITVSQREILIGDRLLPEDRSKLENLFFPQIPDREVNGQIISLYDALFGVAKYQIVVINKGERDGIKTGHLLATFTQGDMARDHYDNSLVKLPNERSGLVMIFKTFDRVSYGLTMESIRIIHKNDVVKTPRF